MSAIVRSADKLWLSSSKLRKIFSNPCLTMLMMLRWMKLMETRLVTLQVRRGFHHSRMWSEKSCTS